MKMSVFLCLLLGLVGCSNKVEQVVKQQLKDPDSAQFKNVKNKCGEVNAKNTYGGYTGFKRFVVVADSVLIESDQEDEILPFSLNWQAHCFHNKSTNEEKAKCISGSLSGAEVLKARIAGVEKNEIKRLVRVETKFKDEINNSYKEIDNAYSTKFKNPDMYALEVLNQCLKH